jgi:hypothetical protein
MRLFTIVAALLIVLCFAIIPAPAGQYHIGYVDSNGYTFGSDGYWYSSGVAYTRTRVEQPGYYTRSGCGYVYQPGNYSYSYQKVVIQQKVIIQQNIITSADADYRARLLKIAEERQRSENFAKEVHALGLQGQFVPTPYGLGFLPGQQYRLNGEFYQQYGGVPYGANANSLYGYSYQQLAQLYGTNDLSILYQQAAQLALGAQRLSGDATNGFQGLVGQEGQNRARVAEILAKRDLAVAMLQALNTPSASGFKFSIEPTGDIRRDDSKMTAEQIKRLEVVRTQSAQKCAVCHNAQVKKGGFDVATYATLSDDDKLVVLRRLTTNDDKTRMPRKATPDGKVPENDIGPGERLVGEELLSWTIPTKQK